MAVDGYRFLEGATRRVMRAWQEREPTPERIPWTPLTKPLSRSTVALVSSAGLSSADDEPFDQEGERRDPWWGDPTHRVLPRDLSTDRVHVGHLHIDPRPAQSDLDCLMPMHRLNELADVGVVGASAERHYSIMGYILQPEELVTVTAPKIAEALAEDEVDLALLVPV